MAAESKTSTLVLAGLSGIFLIAGAVLTLDPGPAGRTEPVPVTRGPKPLTVRISADQLLKGDGDASGLDCYACHDEKKPPELKFDENRRLVFPKEHSDLILGMSNCAACHSGDPVPELAYAADGSAVIPAAHQDLLAMAHGRNNRNDNCFNCHNPEKLNELVTREGAKLSFSQAPLLCASCHGPTYRDWEAGVHGRTNGFWDTRLGKATRQDCTSCHDPHAPAFPKLIPLPGPRNLHAPGASAKEEAPAR